MVPGSLVDGRNQNGPFTAYELAVMLRYRERERERDVFCSLKVCNSFGTKKWINGWPSGNSKDKRCEIMRSQVFEDPLSLSFEK